LTTPCEQRNPYAGSPPRAWIVVRLTARDGTLREFKLIADTGSPFPFIVSSTVLAQFNHGEAPHANTNFGILEGAWFRFAMPEFGLTQRVSANASDDVVAAATINHPDFEGLAGLPLLRLLRYGGDTAEFWIRPTRATP